MRLLKLSANKPTFHTVVFNRKGISLIVAEQKSERSETTKTYNGVGKTLMLELLHYCLGSNRIEAFEKHLKGWVFFLTIETDGDEHTIGRSADKPNEITLDDKPRSLRDLRSFLESASFEGKLGNIKHLTFRSLIRRFIRSGRGAYVEFSYASKGESKKPFSVMLRGAFLLGLNIELAIRKFELRTRQSKFRETMGQLEKEPIFAELLAEDAVDIELVALREHARQLEANLQGFEVAEDYHEIEREANRIKRRLDRHRREEVKLAEAIVQVDRSLRTKGDIPAERVFQVYEEAHASLPEAIKKRIEEVVGFQRDLQKKRVFRLTREREGLVRELKQWENQVRELSAELNKKVRYLSEHRALDEYIAVNEERNDIQKRIAKLEESKAIRDRVDRELKRIELDLAEENIRADEYLASAEALIAEATGAFRSYARELYGPRRSGLSIGNDAGDNQLRYRIDAHITADAAEGINEAKIFCFDMTLLTLRRGHFVDFLAHDSTLFGPIDPRQRLTMLRIADRVCRELGTQYIATLNLHDITSIQEQVPISEEEFGSLFGDGPVVLRLTDESPEAKLLGIELDMNYMK